MEGLFEYMFFRNALLGILVIGIASAMIGTYVISRRLVALSGGVTHACFGGLGLGYFLGINPIVTAALFAVGASASVEWLSGRFHVRSDSAIAVVWAVGMAVGVLFVFLTPGYVPELNSFLFGNILTISSYDLWVFSGFTLVLALFFILFYDKIIACAFDRDFATVSGLPVRFVTYAMTVFVAVCIVLTIRMVGIMLLMSMLAMPQMIAEIYFHRFKGIMFFSIAVSVVCGIFGVLVSAYVNVPCSAIIVISLVALFLLLRAVSPLCRLRSSSGKKSP